MKKLFIIKIGGNVIDDTIYLNSFLKELATINESIILVHGGGVLATKLSNKIGIETKMVDGRRITDEETLKVTAMVYAGLVNKQIAAKLSSYNKLALGLSGADGLLVPSKKREIKEIDYGYVGDVLVDEINSELLYTLINNKITPVIAPITSDKNGQLLNTNADTIASSIAISLSKYFETHLLYCFEKDGIIYKNEIQKTFTKELFSTSVAEGEVTGGMIPKITTALNAFENGVNKVKIGCAANLLKLITDESGTRIN